MNFPLIMLILLLITGSIALLDRFVLQRRRDAVVLAPLRSGQLGAHVTETIQGLSDLLAFQATTPRRSTGSAPRSSTAPRSAHCGMTSGR
mgnify:CR=1 FL=1